MALRLLYRSESFLLYSTSWLFVYKPSNATLAATIIEFSYLHLLSFFSCAPLQSVGVNIATPE